MIHLGIVDDHLLVREGLRRVFDTEADITVVAEFGDGAELLSQRTRIPRIDVLFLDITMPKSNGMEVLREVVTWDRAPAVVFLSMHPEDTQVRAAVEAGARGYLTKDASDSVLREAVRSVANGGLYLSKTGTKVLLADTQGGGSKEDDRLAELSSQERVVFDRLCLGQTIKEIAYEIEVSEKSVSTYKSRLMRKLEVASLAELFRFCSD